MSKKIILAEGKLYLGRKWLESVSHGIYFNGEQKFTNYGMDEGLFEKLREQNNKEVKLILEVKEDKKNSRGKRG